MRGASEVGWSEAGRVGEHDLGRVVRVRVSNHPVWSASRALSSRFCDANHPRVIDEFP
jgi:hypothetical protein